MMRKKILSIFWHQKSDLVDHLEIKSFIENKSELNFLPVHNHSSPAVYLINKKNKVRGFNIDLFDEQKNYTINEPGNLGLKDNVFKFWLAIILAGLLVLSGRTAFLQLFKGADFKLIAEGNRIRIHDLKASRGVIYDRNHQMLVENIPGFSLAIIPVDLPRDEKIQRQIAEEIGKITNLPSAQIFEMIVGQQKFSYQPLVILENLNQEQAILTKILSSRYPGVILKTDSTRNYLFSDSSQSLSHLLGYSGKIEEDKKNEYLEKNYAIDDLVGKTGLELFYERELKGVNGREEVEVDATGQAKDIIASQKPESGQNLVLTIDLSLQQKAEQSLRQILSAYGKSRGSVVVLDPRNGEILSLVSLPAFDNNLFRRGLMAADFEKLINDPNRPLFNRVISGEYPSGSTFKLIIGAAALEEGIINENTGFNSVGGINVSRWFFPDWKAGGHGWTNIYKALAESVNTFFYIIGGGYNDFEGLGVAKIKRYAQNFGLNQRLNIDLPNEATGFLPNEEWKEKTKNEQWYIGDTYHLAIGQGDILVTPLQVAAWTSVFASGGKLYQPHLVKEELTSDDQIKNQISPKILNQNFISEKNIKIINRGLRQAVLTGSARRLSELPIAVAAKTGTAEWSSRKSPHAWLTAFAPYEDPQIVVTVLVEEGGEGSAVALPVAREIINWWAVNRYKNE